MPTSTPCPRGRRRGRPAPRRGRRAGRCARRRAGPRPGLEECGHRGLGVDDEGLASRQPDHHVGTDPAVVRADARDLLVEVAAGEHARGLEDPPQLHLAPRPADRRGAQRARRARPSRPRPWVSASTRAKSVRSAPNCSTRSRSSTATCCSTRARASLSGASGRRLQVLGQRGLEVDHPLAQQVALGLDRGHQGREHRRATAARPRRAAARPEQNPHPSRPWRDARSGAPTGPGNPRRSGGSEPRVIARTCRHPERTPS